MTEKGFRYDSIRDHKTQQVTAQLGLFLAYPSGLNHGKLTTLMVEYQEAWWKGWDAVKEDDRQTPPEPEEVKLGGRPGAFGSQDAYNRNPKKGGA